MSPSNPTHTHLLSILQTLPLSSPTLKDLLTTHKPFQHPSHLPQTATTKLIQRINAAILSKDPSATSERRAACEIMAGVLEMDEEGWVFGGWGRGLVGCSIGVMSSTNTTLAMIIPHLILLRTIILESANYPAFERDTVHPVMGKIGVNIIKVFERCLQEQDWNAMLETISTLQRLIIHSPAPFRPTTPSLRQYLLSLILHTSSFTSASGGVPPEIRLAAADTLASLHLTGGKAQASVGWGNEMRDALGGFGMAVGGATSDAWLEDPLRVIPPPPPATMDPLPSEPASRLPVALNRMEGWVEVVLALLRFPTQRPVAVPIAQIVAAGLRCLNLTFDTPVVAHITPQHHAALMTALPRIWTCGLLLVAGVATACGDHLFPHLGLILDHTTWLTERIPISMTTCHLQLLRFHQLFFNLYPPALVPIEYPSRLLKYCLGQYSPVFDPRPVQMSTVNGNVDGGKKGKKRARGMEDGLVGGLEGRGQKTLDVAECQMIVEALRLSPILHSTPLLSPSLLTLSIRLHLALYLHISQSSWTCSNSSTSSTKICDGAADVLEKALLLSPAHGTQQGWKTVVMAALGTKTSTADLLLHPSLPPLHRPVPPLESFTFLQKEGEEEKLLRQELGYTADDDADVELEDTSGMGDVKMNGEEDSEVVHEPSQPTAHALNTAPAQSTDQIEMNSAQPPLPLDIAPSSQKPASPDDLRSLPTSNEQAGIADPSTQDKAQHGADAESIIDTTVPTTVFPSTVSSDSSRTFSEGTNPFMSTPTPLTTAITSAAQMTTRSEAMDEDSDGPIPELDSGSDDEIVLGEEADESE